MVSQSGADRLPTVAVEEEKGTFTFSEKENVPFSSSQMRPRDVNHASQRSEDEAGRLRKGLSDPCAQDIPNNCDTVGGLRRVKSKGECWLRDGPGRRRIRFGSRVGSGRAHP